MDLTGVTTFSRGSGNLINTIPTLQQVYNVSTSPQIVTNVNSMVIKSGLSTPQNMIILKDNNNSIVTQISNTGNIVCVDLETNQARIRNGLRLGDAPNDYIMPIDSTNIVDGLQFVYHSLTKELKFERPQFLDVVTVTTGLTFNTETIIMDYPPIQLLKSKDMININLTGALTTPNLTGNELIFNVYVCDITIPILIQFPQDTVTLQQFSLDIKFTLRTSGTNGTSYCISKFEYDRDDGTHKVLNVQSFQNIDTTSASQPLAIKGGWVTFGSDCFVRGGFMKIN
jgi:hypothetical protein